MEGTDVSEQVEATDAAALGQGDAPSLLEQYLNDPSHDYKTLKYGDVMDGVIMRIDRDEILVDIGSKSEGIVPVREFSSLTSDEKQELAIGDTLLVFVVQPENQEGQAVVSIDRARQEKSWRRLQEIYEANEVIEAEVTNYNKGGLLVNLDGVRGFVPASQVSEIRGGDDASKQADMARLIGTSLPLKVIEINRHRNRLILSERQAVQERRDVMKERLIEELKEGEVRRGRVSSICDFGAFVDIGGADGLVHLSELSWSRVRHPSEILKVGQEIDVYVLGINAQEKKIALSIKRTQAEPWSQVAAKYEVGQLVRGTVTQLANFGAFARIEDGIEGLIHVSELTDERISHPKQVVKEGDDLLLRIIRIDPQRRRMGLSLRRALDTPDTELEQVFGEGILEERDRIVQSIRASLEAEGIEIGSGRRDDDDERPAAEAAGEGAAQAQPAAPLQIETPADRAAAAFAASAERAEAPAERSRRSRRQESAEVSVDLGDEPLSAIGMAFAMAGADLGLVDADGTEAAAEGGDLAPAVEASEAVVAAFDAPAEDSASTGDATASAAAESVETAEGIEVVDSGEAEAATGAEQVTSDGAAPVEEAAVDEAVAAPMGVRSSADADGEALAEPETAADVVLSEAPDVTPGKARRGHPVAEIKDLPDEAREKLHGLSIRTVEDLVARGRSASARGALATELGVDVKQLTEWVNRADLMRLTGVGTEMANLLEESGVDSVKELRHRVPANLHTKLSETNEQRSTAHRAPSLAQVEAWIAEAKTLTEE